MTGDRTPDCTTGCGLEGPPGHVLLQQRAVPCVWQVISGSVDWLQAGNWGQTATVVSDDCIHCRNAWSVYGDLAME